MESYKYICKKILPEYFDAISDGSKPFELREDSDDVRVGDILKLYEWAPGRGGYFTGRSVEKLVSYVLRDAPQFGLMPGYCVIGLTSSEHM